jgi:putative MFS transporter
VGFLVGGIFAGLICDLFGRKKVLVSCMIFWGLCGVFQAYSWSLDFLIAARVLLGVGLGAQIPAVLTLPSELLPSKIRAKYMVTMMAVLPLGAATSGIISYYLIPIIGWRGVSI